MSIAAGSAVRLTDEARKDRQIHDVSSRIYSIIGWYDGVAWLESVGSNSIHCVLMGVKLHELVRVPNSR